MLPAIIAIMLIGAAAVVILRLRNKRDSRQTAASASEDESAVSWRADAMSGARPPVPEKPVKAPKPTKPAKVAKAARALTEPTSLPVSDLAAKIATSPGRTPTAPAPVPPAAKSSPGRNKAAAARSRAAAARSKVAAKPAVPVPAPLSFDPFDDYLSAPPVAPAPTTQGESPTGKTLADVRLGDYRIGDARDTKTGPDKPKSNEKV
jgi:hypothetical protein